jgi:hypothetical protein
VPLPAAGADPWYTAVAATPDVAIGEAVILGDLPEEVPP